ncbi:MAG: hypothetical protein K6F69_02480 [Treponema sp.]|nr:hypothetical protein [Treponema sp.]
MILAALIILSIFAILFWTAQRCNTFIGFMAGLSGQALLFAFSTFIYIMWIN